MVKMRLTCHTTICVQFQIILQMLGIQTNKLYVICSDKMHCKIILFTFTFLFLFGTLCIFKVNFALLFWQSCLHSGDCKVLSSQSVS